MAGLHQDVAIRGELRARGRDDAGGRGARHGPGAYGPRYNAGGPPEEDYEQRDGATGADVRHLAGFPRLTATLPKILRTDSTNVEINRLIGTITSHPMDLIFNLPLPRGRPKTTCCLSPRREKAEKEGDERQEERRPFIILGLIIT